ncbi:hypothetical protein B0P06_004541 [Clostridium saccharoperbutylacetonicum]|uniref:DUF1287 domain-containing protein n=1 Tax=Clostridium saccharoperbutylacetonicum N1-4(HMT) TaxID=931276 RepID=M1MGW9_9CLOT|nr:DUF1287 domain-containing protein [Clostridium saccharoperbutylacetonicum]AGF57169.1 hypothetical protein Cspa_c34080 [Clostridium saccharoperbutylacetonicum N1-4(HMT)]NRT62072.1 hypothetical protein [Clostridium saccharoperbutylacetonicum]NSB25402.1 hypothetical protein [Clostridium saccharoperbutylacetonicum]NSB44770.1 hypothetical protein [Clostridium saccharoperbutylacetonicum]
MKKAKTIIIVLSLIAIISATVTFVVKLKYNKPNNELNNKVEEIADDISVNRVNVPDESSKVDKNQNGIPDPIDIVNSARKEAERKTIYKDAYYVGGYPPDGEGVCTDVIWRGFKGINVSIKDLMDKDIKENIPQYKGINGKADPNIDFRRVLNQDVFFKKNCIQLTTEFKENDINNLKEWQPGDIIVFIEGYEHIAIISDKRDEDGIPYVIHNSHPCASEAKLSWFHNPIHGHYRWKY